MEDLFVRAARREVQGLVAPGRHRYPAAPVRLADLQQIRDVDFLASDLRLGLIHQRFERPREARDELVE